MGLMSGKEKKTLAELIPDIVNYWDYEKNGDLKPENISYNSTEKAYVFCPVCQESRYTQINYMCRKNADGMFMVARCQPCSLKEINNNKKVYAVNVCEDFLKWWDVDKNVGVSPYDVAIGTKKRYYFRCPECGESILRIPLVLFRKQEDGTYKAVPCQKCHPTKSSLKVALTDAVPDIYEYWDYEKNNGVGPEGFGASAGDKVWTKCPSCGTSVIRNIRFTWKKDENGIGHVIHCRTCGKRTKENALVNFVDVTKYWDYERNEHPPEYYTVSSGKKVYMRCPECSILLYRPICDSITQTRTGEYHVAACLDCSSSGVYRRRWKLNLNTMLNCCPEITKYWDYERNKYRPEELMRSSEERIYIRCPTCGDLIYRQGVTSLRMVDGKWSVVQCFKCGTETAIKTRAHENPIVDAYPQIMDWWDYDENTHQVEDISHRSRYEASFICPQCSAKFKRPVRSFITVHRDGSYRPVGCPECGYCPRENPEDNLKVLCPEITEWWNYEKNYPHVPEEFTKGASFEAYLTCPDCGMELYTQIKSLVETLEDGTVSIRHKGKCRKLRAQKSENNLVKQMPEILEWWNYEKNAPNRPEDYTLYGAASVYLNCPDCGAEFYRRLGDSFYFEEGVPKLLECPICADIKVQAGINDLQTTHPELAKEYSPNNERDVRKIRKGHIYPVKWICPTCAGEYRYLVSEREVGDDVCPYCAGRKVLVGFNDLQTTHPELAKEYSPSNEVDIRILRKASWYHALWICPTCSGEYACDVREREIGDDSCPYCADRKALPGYNTFDVRQPDLMKEWLMAENILLGISPDEILETSTEKVWWRCLECDYRYLLTPRKRVLKKKRGHNSCPRCNGHRWLQVHFV